MSELGEKIIKRIEESGDASSGVLLLVADIIGFIADEASSWSYGCYRMLWRLEKDIRHYEFAERAKESKLERENKQ